MNANTQIYEQYKKTSVETLSPGKLLLMLYNGCIKNIESAKKAIAAKDAEKAHDQIVKAQNIIIELMTTLNMDYEISMRLMTVYDYIYNQMVEANIKKDSELLDEIRIFLIDLRDTWEGAISKVNNPGNANQYTRDNFIITG